MTHLNSLLPNVSRTGAGAVRTTAAHGVRVKRGFHIAALILLALDLALIAGLIGTGARRFSVLGAVVSVRHLARPFGFALLLALVAAWTSSEGRVGLQRIARDLIAPFRMPGVLRKFGAGLFVIVFAANIAAVLEGSDAARKVLKKASQSPGAIFTNGMDEHLKPLIGRITRRTTAAPVVVDIWAADARGHLAAFYSYPRLVYIAPALRRWSLATRMDGEQPDPLFAAPGERPEAMVSESFARERGFDVLQTYPRDDWLPELHER